MIPRWFAWRTKEFRLYGAGGVFMYSIRFGCCPPTTPVYAGGPVSFERHSSAIKGVTGWIPLFRSIIMLHNRVSSNYFGDIYGGHAGLSWEFMRPGFFRLFSVVTLPWRWMQRVREPSYTHIRILLFYIQSPSLWDHVTIHNTSDCRYANC